MDKPKCLFKNGELKLGYIFNSTFWVCPYIIQFWVKTTQHCLECNDDRTGLFL